MGDPDHSFPPPGPAAPANGETAETVRDDLQAGIRHLHFMAMQTKHDVVDVASRLSALIDELMAAGRLDPEPFDERRLRLKEGEEQRLRQRAYVQVAPVEDKYALEKLPVVDCAALLPLCQARCCRLPFPLSFQDLDERIVEWDYSAPYQIRQRPDGYCVHHDPATGGCGVYAHRPATCRKYDCRQDRRIWLDFERRIPAPFPAESELLAPLPPAPGD